MVHWPQFFIHLADFWYSERGCFKRCIWKNFRRRPITVNRWGIWCRNRQKSAVSFQIAASGQLINFGYFIADPNLSQMNGIFDFLYLNVITENWHTSNIKDSSSTKYCLGCCSPLTMSVCFNTLLPLKFIL